MLTKIILVLLGVQFWIYEKKFRVEFQLVCAGISWAILKVGFASSPIFLTVLGC